MLDLFALGGDIGTHMGALDWTSTPVGRVDDWPPLLRHTLALMLPVPRPMCLSWGQQQSFFYNNAYAPLLGDRHPGAIARGCADFPELWPELNAVIAAADAGEAIELPDFDMASVPYGPDSGFYSFTYTLLRDEDGRVAGVFCVGAETTAKIRADQALRTSHDRMRAVLDGMDEGFILLDRDWRVLEVNSETLRHGRRTREEVIGRNHFELWPNLQDSEFARLYRLAMVDRIPVRHTGRYRFFDGAEGWLDMRAQPFGDGIAIFYHDITRFRAQQEAVAQSEERLRLALEASRTIVWDWDPVTRRTERSANAVDLLGIGSSDQEFGRDMVHPDDRDAMREAFRATMAGERDFEAMYRVKPVGADGYLAFDARAHLIRDEAGQPRRMLGVMMDVTAREQARAAAATREQDFALLADNMSQLAWLADADGNLTWFNKRWYDYTGFQYGSVPDPSVLFDPEQRDGIFRSFRTAIRAGEPWEDTFQLKGAHGGYSWFLTRAQPIRDADGRITRWFGTNTDIDAVKRLEGELQDLNATLEARVRDAVSERNRVYELSQDLFASAGFDGRLRAFNPAWTKLLGTDPETLTARPFIDFVHPDDQAKVRDAVLRLRAGEPVAGFEHRAQGADGREIWLSWTAVAEGDLFHAVGRDVTLDKERDAQLAQVQRLETIGQLAGGIAHDFNNLLTPIIGSLDLLQRKYAGDPATLRLLGAALQAAERAKTLVQRLLAFARRQHLAARSVDVATTLAGLRDLLAQTLGPDVELVIEAATDLPNATVDPDQLEMVLLNLAVNARDAMPGGGRLTIAAGSAAGVDAPGDLTADAFVQVTVIDDGRGMDQVTLGRAIEPFFTTKPPGKGTGLGLSMVHGFAVQSGGALELDSRPGGGTRATLWLPAADSPAAPAPNAAAAASPPAAARILLVDDEPLVRGAAAAMLVDLGHDVREVDGAAEALAALDAERFDLLITDYLMPGQTGAELIAVARRQRPDLPVLLITGFADAGAGVDALIGVPRLAKPFRQHALEREVSRLLGGAAEPHPGV